MQESMSGYLTSDEAIKIIKDVYSSQPFYDDLLRDIKATSMEAVRVQCLSKNLSQRHKPSIENSSEK